MKSIHLHGFICLYTILNIIRPAHALWGVYVTFENNCRRSVRVSISGGESGSLLLSPYEEDSFYICTSWCTGFLGASKTHYYSYSAETESSRYDCYWSGSGDVSISGFNVGSKGAYHSLTCDGSCANDPSPPPPKRSPPPPKRSPPPPSPPPPSPPPPVQQISVPDATNFATQSQGDSGSDFEKFSLKLDWNPSSCYQDSVCSVDRIKNAFTVDVMRPKLVDDTQENPRCWDIDSYKAQSLVVSNEVSEGTLRAMECVFQNSAGANEDLWQDVYVKQGSCTGLDVGTYFDTVIKLYSLINLNRIAYEFGITDGSRIVKTNVDRNEFVDFISSKLGKKAWIECEPESMVLKKVVVCVAPYAPYRVIDCTFDRTDPTLDNGIPCDGTLMLPTNQDGGYVSETCKPYIPYGMSQNWVDPKDYSPYLDYESMPAFAGEDDQGGTNVGALVGGIVGGVLGLAIIIGLIVFFCLRRKSKKGEATGEKHMYANGVYESQDKPAMKEPVGVTGSLDSAYVPKDLEGFDPYKTWINSIVQEYNPRSAGKKNEFDFSHVSLGRPLGEGSFGRVYEATYNGDQVALKIFLDARSMKESSLEGLTAASADIVEKMEKEVTVMASLNHPNIVRFMGFCRVPPCIMTEVCSRENLSEMLARHLQKKTKFSWKKRLQVATDIANGIEYLHGRSIIHRDLKSPNILMSADGVAKISDFNLSKILDDSMKSICSSVATCMNPRWLAPELLDGNKPTKSSDIFSFGVIMWELLTFEIPWGSENYWLVVKKLQSGERLRVRHDPTVCPLPTFEQYYNLMNQCWEQDESKRPTIEKVKRALKSIG